MPNQITTTQNLAASDVPQTGPDAVVAQLRLAQQLIPDFAQLPVTTRRQALAVANLDPKFVQATISGVGASPLVQQILGRTPDELRLDTEDAAHWLVVENELSVMLKGVIASNLLRRQRIGQTALQTYAVARRLARQPEHAGLLGHVETMKEASKFRRKKKAVAPAPSTPKPTPAPAPVPATPPTTPKA